MKMKNYLLSLGTVLLGTAVILSSCSKDESGDGSKLSYKVKPVNYTASVGATASGSGLVVVANTNSSLTWTSGNINVHEIDFEAKSKTVKIEYELKSLLNIDLFNLSPVLGSISIPDGTYDEVELKLVMKKSTTNIPFTLKGTYTNGVGVKTPVEFYFNDEFEVEVEAEDIVVNGTKDYLGLINVQLNKLLVSVSSLDLDNAVKVNGAIVISSSSNVSLYNKIIMNVQAFADCDFDD